MKKKNNKQKEEKELPPLMGPPKKNTEIEEKTKSKTKQNKSNFNAETMPKASEDIVTKMVQTIKDLNGLREYKIREMVNDTEELGKKLAQNLKTNQVRKFLDAVNRLKAQPEKEKDFEEIKSGVQLLRPQLAYAAARQKGAVDLRLVMEAAINRINEAEDFTRFVQLTESIIAYHKAAGGRD